MVIFWSGNYHGFLSRPSESDEPNSIRFGIFLCNFWRVSSDILLDHRCYLALLLFGVDGVTTSHVVLTRQALFGASMTGFAASESWNFIDPEHPLGHGAASGALPGCKKVAWQTRWFFLRMCCDCGGRSTQRFPTVGQKKLGTEIRQGTSWGHVSSHVRQSGRQTNLKFSV